MKFVPSGPGALAGVVLPMLVVVSVGLAGCTGVAHECGPLARACPLFDQPPAESLAFHEMLDGTTTEGAASSGRIHITEHFFSYPVVGREPLADIAKHRFYELLATRGHEMGDYEANFYDYNDRNKPELCSFGTIIIADNDNEYGRDRPRGDFSDHRAFISRSSYCFAPFANHYFSISGNFDSGDYNIYINDAEMGVLVDEEFGGGQFLQPVYLILEDLPSTRNVSAQVYHYTDSTAELWEYPLQQIWLRGESTSVSVGPGTLRIGNTTMEVEA